MVVFLIYVDGVKVDNKRSNASQTLANLFAFVVIPTKNGHLAYPHVPIEEIRYIEYPHLNAILQSHRNFYTKNCIKCLLGGILVRNNCHFYINSNEKFIYLRGNI